MLKRALGAQGKQLPQKWPRRGWGDPAERHPDKVILTPAIEVIRQSKLDIAKQVRGDMYTNKNGWGELLLRKLLEDPKACQAILDHPLSRRLVDVLGR